MPSSYLFMADSLPLVFKYLNTLKYSSIVIHYEQIENRLQLLMAERS